MLEELPAEFWQGFEQFNQGDFYACHDTLEAVWIESPVFEKNFYQGILQVAVSLYHLSNHNWRGAVILLGEGLNRLRKYPPDFGGIDVDEFITQAAELLSALQTAGSDRVQDILLVPSSKLNPAAESGQIILIQPTLQKHSTLAES
jgi:uncharacterized protein